MCIFITRLTCALFSCAVPIYSYFSDSVGPKTTELLTGRTSNLFIEQILVDIICNYYIIMLKVHNKVHIIIYRGITRHLIYIFLSHYSYIMLVLHDYKNIITKR